MQATSSGPGIEDPLSQLLEQRFTRLGERCYLADPFAWKIVRSPVRFSARSSRWFSNGNSALKKSATVLMGEKCRMSFSRTDFKGQDHKGDCLLGWVLIHGLQEEASDKSRLFLADEGSIRAAEAVAPHRHARQAAG